MEDAEKMANPEAFTGHFTLDDQSESSLLAGPADQRIWGTHQAEDIGLPRRPAPNKVGEKPKLSGRRRLPGLEGIGARWRPRQKAANLIPASSHEARAADRH